MTEAEQRVDELVRNPPRVELTTAQKVYRVLSVFFSVLTVLALALSLVAVFRTAAVAACTNTNLGTRNITSTRDNTAQRAFVNAERDWINAVEAVFTTPRGTISQRAAVRLLKTETARLKDVSAHTSRVLAIDQSFRLAHPLGRC